MSRRSLQWLTTATATLGAAVALAATSFEKPRVLPVDDVLPADVRSGEGFTVADEVSTDGFFEHFTLETQQFGEFPATSNFELQERIHEVAALKALDEIQNSEAYAKAFAKAGAAPAYLVKGLVTHPVDTVTAVPKGIYKGGKRAVTWLAGDRRDRAETENSATREAIGFSKRKRELAGKLEVDPYSTNEKLQDGLNRVAWASFAGGLTVSAALAAVMIPPVADVTYKAARTSQGTRAIVLSRSGGDLYRRNREELKKMGLDPEQVETFLNNVHLSPTDKTLITLALEALGGGSGLEQAVARGTEVVTVNDVIRLTGTIEMSHGYHRQVGPVTEIVRFGNDLVVLTESRQLVATLPADRLAWTEQTSELAEAMSGFEPKEGKVTGRELWLSGEFTPRAREELGRRGFGLHEETMGQLYVDYVTDIDEAGAPKARDEDGESQE